MLHCTFLLTCKRCLAHTSGFSSSHCCPECHKCPSLFPPPKHSYPIFSGSLIKLHNILHPQSKLTSHYYRFEHKPLIRFTLESIRALLATNAQHARRRDEPTHLLPPEPTLPLPPLRDMGRPRTPHHSRHPLVSNRARRSGQVGS